MVGVRILTATAFSLALAGCGYGPPPTPKGVEIGGKVLLPSGSTLTGGTLLFRPTAGIHGASALIQKDGSFQMIDPAGKKSVVPGKYQVFVLFKDPSLKALRSSVHQRYQDSEDGDSDIFVEIGDPKNDLLIRLKS